VVFSLCCEFPLLFCLWFWGVSGDHSKFVGVRVKDRRFLRGISSEFHEIDYDIILMNSFISENLSHLTQYLHFSP
jgi:hypothetical protein